MNVMKALRELSILLLLICGILGSAFGICAVLYLMFSWSPFSLLAFPIAAAVLLLLTPPDKELER